MAKWEGVGSGNLLTQGLGPRKWPRICTLCPQTLSPGSFGPLLSASSIPNCLGLSAPHPWQLVPSSCQQNSPLLPCSESVSYPLAQWVITHTSLSLPVTLGHTLRNHRTQVTKEKWKLSSSSRYDRFPMVRSQGKQAAPGAEMYSSSCIHRQVTLPNFLVPFSLSP